MGHRVEFVRNCLGQLQQGWAPSGWACVTPGRTHSAFWGGSRQRSENATKVCQVPFFDQISMLYWNHSMQHRFMFECIVSFFVVCLFHEWSQEKLSWQCFLKRKTNQTRTISIFLLFLYISQYFFSFSSLVFFYFIWPNVLRCDNSFYHFRVIDYLWVHIFLYCFEDTYCREAIAEAFNSFDS